MAARKLNPEAWSPFVRNEPNKLLFAVDIAGTLVFAVEGATAAMFAVGTLADEFSFFAPVVGPLMPSGGLPWV
jgi:hypothetical protein